MRFLLPDATPVVRRIFNDGPLTVAVFPDASSTISVEFSVSSEADVEGGTALWQAWGKGTVAAAAADHFPSPISALRFTAVSGTGQAEYLGLRNLP